MAWYNPNPISFNADAAIIKNSGAVGDFFKQNADDNYKRILQQEETQRAKDYFQFQKDRAGTQDTQWADKFAFDKDRFQTENEMKMAEGLRADMRHQDDLGLRTKQLGLSQQHLGLAQQEAKQRLAEKQALGMAYGNMYPDLAQQMGATKTTYTAGQQPEAQKPQGMSTINPIISDIVYGSKPTQTPVVSKQVIDPTKASMLAGLGEVAKLQDGKRGDTSWQDVGGSKVLVNNKSGDH